MARFIHTSDWQLGMTRRFLNPEAHATYNKARLDVVRAIGRLAKAESCAFIAVAGDVFEYEHLERRTVLRALEAMGEAGVPVVLLPGNHDPHHADSLYMSSEFTSSQFTERAGGNITVLADATPRRITPEIEVVGAPWHSKHPGGNPVIAALADLPPADGAFRVCLAHGYVDSRAFSQNDEDLIPMALLEKAIADGVIHYAALGDKHSCDVLDKAGRIRYSGTPEPTDFDEDKPGHVYIVDLAADSLQVREHRVGTWNFLKLSRPVAGIDDVLTLDRDLRALADKTTTVIRLELTGGLEPAEDEDLRRRLDELSQLFAGLEVQDDGYFVNPGDLKNLCSTLGGYAASAAETLRTAATVGGDGATMAVDALLLLSRLAAAGMEDDR